MPLGLLRKLPQYDLVLARTSSRGRVCALGPRRGGCRLYRRGERLETARGRCSGHVAASRGVFLGGRRRHAPSPRTEAGRIWTHQLQLTIADLVAEIHDTHHPIAGSLYYEDQRVEAQRRAADFVAPRAPKFLGRARRWLIRVYVEIGGRGFFHIRLPYLGADASVFHNAAIAAA
jgi:hypothetical protein